MLLIITKEYKISHMVPKRAETEVEIFNCLEYLLQSWIRINDIRVSKLRIYEAFKSSDIMKSFWLLTKVLMLSAVTFNK